MTPGKYAAATCPPAESQYPVKRVEKKLSGAVMFSCRWKLKAEIVDGLEEPCKSEYITSYTCLVSKDGNLNEIGYKIATHQKLFNWDGSSFKGLVENNNTVEALLTLKEEYYNGKLIVKVDWIDTLDGDLSGGVETRPASDLDALDREFSKLLNKPKKAVEAPIKAVEKEVAEDEIPF